MHYRRYRIYGDPLMVRTAIGEPISFFENTVMSFQGDECLEWRYARSSDGCAVLYYEGASWRVPRLLCKLVHGDAPSSEHVAAHSCGRGHMGCVNPNHIRWATHQENMDDRARHGTTARGESNSEAKLTEDEVRKIRAMAERHTHRAIADKFAVSETAVSRIISGKTWKHLS